MDQNVRRAREDAVKRNTDTHVVNGGFDEAGRDAGNAEGERDEVLGRGAWAIGEEEDRVDVLDDGAAREFERRITLSVSSASGEEMAEIDDGRSMLVKKGEEGGFLCLGALGRCVGEEEGHTTEEANLSVAGEGVQRVRSGSLEERERLDGLLGSAFESDDVGGRRLAVVELSRVLGRDGDGCQLEALEAIATRLLWLLLERQLLLADDDDVRCLEDPFHVGSRISSFDSVDAHVAVQDSRLSLGVDLVASVADVVAAFELAPPNLAKLELAFGLVVEDDLDVTADDADNGPGVEPAVVSPEAEDTREGRRERKLDSGPRGG